MTKIELGYSIIKENVKIVNLLDKDLFKAIAGYSNKFWTSKYRAEKLQIWVSSPMNKGWIWKIPDILAL